MNRRGFFSLVGKLLAVGSAIGIDPRLLRPVKAALVEDIIYIDAAREDLTVILPPAEVGKTVVLHRIDDSTHVVTVVCPTSQPVNMKLPPMRFPSKTDD
jgi:hypothetical protein